jgi:RsiW-degrading membrane proteinase PrsW (M82 family)
MNIYASLAICFIPLIAIFVCMKLLLPSFKINYGLISCLLGLLAVIPIAAIQFFIENKNLFSVTTLGSVLLQAIVINGFVEETIKMSLLFILPSKTELPSFFSYSLLSGLAVACFESLIYLISGYENIGLRMVTAVVIHTCCAGLSGLFVFSIRHKKTSAKNSSAKKQPKLETKSKRTAKKVTDSSTPSSIRIIAYIFAVLLHGVYNYFAGFNTGIKYFSIAAILFALIECRVQYKAVSDSSIK